MGEEGILRQSVWFWSPETHVRVREVPNENRSERIQYSLVASIAVRVGQNEFSALEEQSSFDPTLTSKPRIV